MSKSFFQNIDPIPISEVFRLLDQFNEDTHPKKVNLGIGVYRTDEGKPWILPVVASTEATIASDKTLNHEYLSMDGMKELYTLASKLILGAESPAIVENRVCAVQALSGTGSLRVIMELLYRFLPTKVIYTSKPTWTNHKTVARYIGYTDLREYRYYNEQTHGLDLNGMLEDLQNAPEGSVIILHGCGHNPTGVDPSQEEWKKIANVVKEKHLFPLMDFAYLGLASGDIDQDAFSIRHFVSEGIELACAQSFAKNFGLYSSRIGCAFFVANTSEFINALRSQVKMIIRATWSNPPVEGARIVAKILGNPASLAEWKECIAIMSRRITSSRKDLYQMLRQLGTPGNWEHIIKHCGMFTFTGLNRRQVSYLLEKYHIYMLSSGRINMCTVTTANLDYVAKAIDDTVRNVTE
ncbi:aspartate aminotransferase, cytoplasmic-like [Xenia sp. Carnegie-2017]|uniref:aspartate aminotransferase, cytoplasmic-like n=1 Tax=Xenia sp. Carnegie-2017 TaxID=2897299 RepID=UPI001F04A1C3|nr:aspartate aminotransferase, cytoplasmic-like [Xenia sp. Carnegie-2017]